MDLHELRITDIFDQDITRDIDPVVQIQAVNDKKLAQEIDEYVVTDAIKEHFKHLLENYLALQEHPNQKIGIWVSGFFGSGKSLFSKMIGYTLENRDLGGETVRQRLLRRFGGDAEITSLFGQLDALEQERPTHAIVFDMAIDAARNREFVSEVMYAQLLEHFNYPADLHLAELEVHLEREGKLDTFEQHFREVFKMEWSEHKRDTVARSRASAIMHRLEPQTYSAPDSWARARGDIDLSPSHLSNRAIEMVQRRGADANLIFVIDEVGQFASRSVQRMLDVQGVMQSFYQGGTRNEPGSGVTPGSHRGRLWLLVTSQEALDSVVENLESSRTELQRLQDRFQNPVDLKPTDITEVIKQRLLKKKSGLEPGFRALFEANQGSLGLHTKLDAGYQRDMNARSFTDLYPLLPYQFDVIIDAISTIRSQGQAGATYGAAVRPILAMVSDLLNSDELKLGSSLVGKLVTFDEVYDLLREKIRQDIKDSLDQIEDQLGEAAMETRAAKALVLLSMARGVKRTLRSVAAVLYPAVGNASIDSEVRAALDKLQEMQRVGFTDGQYEFLSQEARDWESERNNIDPGTQIRTEVRKVIAHDVANQSYNHRGLKTFTPGLHLDGTIPTGYSRGDIDVRLRTDSTDPDEAFKESQAQQNAICGVISISLPVEEAARQLLRSRTMIQRYERDDTHAQQVTRERQRVAGYENTLETALHQALLEAQYYFRGRDVSPSVSNINKLIEALFEPVVDEVFHKLGDLTITPRGPDSQALFTQSNLSTMNEMLGPSGLGVLKSEGGQTRIDTNAAIFGALSQFLQQRSSTGQTANGREIEQEFDKDPYGWSSDRVRYLTAVYFRASAIEMHAQGDRFTAWNDPGAQDVFTSIAKYRSAQFSPRSGALDLTDAVDKYYQLTGEFIEELDEAVIAQRIRSTINGLADSAQKVVGRLEAHELPGVDSLTPAAEALNEIRSSNSSEDVVRLFVGNHARIVEAKPAIAALMEKLDGETLGIVQEARDALQRLYPAIPRPRADAQQAREQLEQDLRSESFFDRLTAIQEKTKVIQNEVAWAYELPWKGRYQKYAESIEELKRSDPFQRLRAEEQEVCIQQLKRFQGQREQVPTEVWKSLNPTIEHLIADKFAADERLREIAGSIVSTDSDVRHVSLKPLRMTLDPSTDGSLRVLDEQFSQLRNEVASSFKRGQTVILE